MQKKERIAVLSRLKQKAAHLKYDASALFLAYKRKDVSVYAKLAILIALGYALSPVDLIPDFIPILGYLDDLILVPLFIRIAIALIPPAVLAECREDAKDLWKDGKPKKWYYALPIMLIWLLTGFLIAKTIAEYHE